MVSVVLGTFNGGKFLVQQLESILAQSYQPLELIISDDASTDNTPQILKQYENRPGIRIYYQEENLGLSANYSFAASLAKGELIAFSDQDDIWKEDKIEKLVKGIREFHLIYSDSMLISETGESLDKKLSDLKQMYSGTDSRGHFLYSCVWGHGMMVTRQLLENSLPFPSEVHHDTWITYKAFHLGGIKYLDDTLTFYRQYETSTTNSIQLKNGKARQARYHAYREKLQWVSIMKQYERPEYQPFYSKLFDLYSEKEKRTYVFPLIPFMLKHRKAIFRFSKKGFASHLVEIIKQARSERPAKNEVEQKNLL